MPARNGSAWKVGGEKKQHSNTLPLRENKRRGKECRSCFDGARDWGVKARRYAQAQFPIGGKGANGEAGLSGGSRSDGLRGVGRQGTELGVSG